MYSYFYSNNKIFWDNNSENRPSVDYFKTLNWNNANIKAFNYISWDSCTINISTIDYYDNKMTYFKIVNNNEVRYYLISTTANENKDTITLMLTLDIWATFSLNIFKENQNIDCLRNHIKNENAFQITDTLLSNIPISYAKTTNFIKYIENKLVGQYYEYTADNGAVLSVNKDTQLSGNIYAVFNGINSISNNYILIPVLNKYGTNRVKIVNNIPAPVGEAKIYISPVGFVVNPTSSYYGHYEVIKDVDEYERLKSKFPNAQITTNYSDIIDLRYMNFYNLDLTLGFPNRWMKFIYGGTRTSSYLFDLNVIYKTDNTDITLKSQHYTRELSGTDYPIEWFKPDGTAIIFTFNGVKSETIYDGVIWNNIDEILKIIKLPEYANRFQGFFFGPCIINTSGNNWKVGDIAGNKHMYVEMSENGVDLKYPLLEYPISTNKDKFNSTNINNSYLLNFFNISYFSNTKNWLYYINTSKDGIKIINICGKLYYNGKLNIITNTCKLKVSESIIEFPYQLPAITDSYVKYVAQSMSSIDTGLRQTQIAADMGLFQQQINMGVGALQSGMQIASKPSASGVLSAASSLFNAGMGIERNRRELANYKESLNARYEDARRVQGAEIHSSAVNDACYLLSNLSDTFGEVLQLKIPTDDTIRNLNNVLYLFGNVNPMNAPINDFLVRENFNYILITDTWISTNLDLIYASHTLAEKSAIATNIAGGFRVWNIFPDLKVEN